MLLAAFEPGKDMAIANFFLAIFCLFTIGLPLLLITRGDKTEENRDFLLATVNPWSQLVKKSNISPVVLSEITSSIKPEPNQELVYGQNIAPIPKSEDVNSLEITGSVYLDESSTEPLATDDELMAA